MRREICSTTIMCRFSTHRNNTRSEFWFVAGTRHKSRRDGGPRAHNPECIKDAGNLPCTLQEILAMQRQMGGLVVSPPVYVELLAYPKSTESFLNDFLADTGIAVDFEFQQPAWVGVGRRFARHATLPCG